MISTMTNFLHDRKGKLITYLNNYTDELSLEKQHQLYGAITELDTMIEILKNLRKKEIHKESNPDEIFLFRPIHSKGFIKEFIGFIKDFF